jgi:DNA-binding MarR family transcriptional regulator
MTEPGKAVAESADRLRHSLLRITRLIRSQRTDMSLTLAELSALTTLCREGPMSAGELAMCEHVQPSSLTKVLASLEDHRYVQRSVRPSDRRQALIEPTPLGRQLLAFEKESRDSWLSTRLERLTPAERAVLDIAAEILDKMVADEAEPAVVTARAGSAAPGPLSAGEERQADVSEAKG